MSRDHEPSGGPFGTDTDDSPFTVVGKTYTTVVSRVIEVLSAREMVGLTPAEIRDEVDAAISIDAVRQALRGLAERDIVVEENGYWRLSDEDEVLGEHTARTLSSLAIEEGEWAVYDDEDVDKLPGIGDT